MVQPPDSVTARLPSLKGHDRVTIRRRIGDALPVVIRTWQDEAEILDALHGVLPHVPQCLVRHGDMTVLSYVQGVPLSTISATARGWSRTSSPPLPACSRT
ncbi:hypothetical protein [Streptomyces sp. SAS_260]|uniref:hypothetical protein n=1 Tax=Streptomyces sp. SAS_260 TaxID=3412751 RepID=UPI00403C92C8